MYAQWCIDLNTASTGETRSCTSVYRISNGRGVSDSTADHLEPFIQAPAIYHPRSLSWFLCDAINESLGIIHAALWGCSITSRPE